MILLCPLYYFHPKILKAGMKTVFLFSLLIVTGDSFEGSLDILDPYWKVFKKIFKKMYKPEEEMLRRTTWEINVSKNILHNIFANLGLESYRRGINAFSDLNTEEFQKHKTGYRMEAGPWGTKKASALSGTNVPNLVDWRQNGSVTSVSDQGNCGSCWAFSALGSLEGQRKKKTGRLVELSKQNMVDCVSGDDCSGGWMTDVYKYIRDEGGVNSERQYPYTGREGRCKFDSSKIAARDTGFEEITEGDEENLKRAVATVGPISAGINARLSSFQNYESGIYNDRNCDSDQLNHAVVVIGYGTEDGKDYWLLKNSWGTSWGIRGYMKLARNDNNRCGIATRASYPLVD